MSPIMDEQVRKGIKFRLLLPENRLPVSTVSVKNVETKGLSDLPAIVILTEKEAGICFRQIGGKIDYAGFFGKDPIFLNWVKDLFLYYGDKVK
jgi:predicted transcriptional regulator